MFQNVEFPDYFPDNIPDSVENYNLDYFPSMMQGTGHASISFKADENAISQYENQFSQKAIMSFDLAEYIDSGNLFNETYKDEMIENGGDKYSSMSFFYDKSLFENTHNVKVYILDSVFDSNHPHTSAVLIDCEKNIVQFSRLG